MGYEITARVIIIGRFSLPKALNGMLHYPAIYNLNTKQGVDLMHVLGRTKFFFNH
jgi:hypothetical protein